MRTVRVKTRKAWREWLEENHDSVGEAWLVFHKKETGIQSVPYDDAVEEALCFGWIDSLIKKLDDRRYARKFTPRRAGSVWSELNKSRALKAIAAGLMTGAGMALFEEARKPGESDQRRQKPQIDADEMPAELAEALAERPKARQRFQALPPSHRKRYVLWIATAKKIETRERRAGEAARILERGEQLGLK